MAAVEVDIRGAIMVITLNRPERKNAIGDGMLRLILEAFRQAASDDDIRAVVTTGAGSTFCVGADMEALAEKAASAEDSSGSRPDRGGLDNGLARLSPLEERLDRVGPGRWYGEMMKFSKPSIAAVNGATAGGGLWLAVLHHFRLASENAKFVAAFGAVGLPPEAGLTYTLPRLIGLQPARRMLVRNELVKAHEALALGLVDKVVPQAELLNRAIAYAEEIAALPPLSVQLTLKMIDGGTRAGWERHVEAEFAAQRQLFATSDHLEAVQAFRERRKGHFTGR